MYQSQLLQSTKAADHVLAVQARYQRDMALRVERIQRRFSPSRTASNLIETVRELFRRSPQASTGQSERV